MLLGRPPILHGLLLLILAVSPAGGAVFGGKSVVLTAPPDQKEGHQPAALAIQLDLAVREMASRGPVELTSPIRVAVEPDYVAQGRQAGEISEAVRGRDADLLLVYDPADLPAYRFALAGVLLDRAGLAGRLPPALRRGAALWLSRDWDGRGPPRPVPPAAAPRA